jgi:hypothetical protein
MTDAYEDGLEAEVAKALEDQERCIRQDHVGPQLDGEDAAAIEEGERMQQAEVAENAQIAGEALRNQLRRQYQPQIDDFIAEELIAIERIRGLHSQCQEADTRYKELVQQQDASLTELQGKKDEVRRLMQDLPGLEENHRSLRSMKGIMLKATVGKWIKVFRARKALAELLRELSSQITLLLAEASKEKGPGSLELVTRVQTEVGTWWDTSRLLLMSYDMHKDKDLKQKAVQLGLKPPRVMDFLDNIRDAQEVLSLMIQQLIVHNNHLRATHLSFDTRNASLALHCQNSSHSITRASRRTKELAILIDQARSKRYKLAEDYKGLQLTYKELKLWISSSGSGNRPPQDHQEKKALEAEQNADKKTPVRRITNSFGYDPNASNKEPESLEKIDKRLDQWSEDMTSAEAKAQRTLFSSGKSYQVQPYRVASAEDSMPERMRIMQAFGSPTNQHNRAQSVGPFAGYGEMPLPSPRIARPQTPQQRARVDGEKRFLEMSRKSPLGQPLQRSPTAPAIRPVKFATSRQHGTRAVSPAPAAPASAAPATARTHRRSASANVNMTWSQPKTARPPTAPAAGKGIGFVPRQAAAVDYLAMPVP